MFTFDFETKAIQPRPDYPPEPVGVAVRNSDRRSGYFAWGHPEENTCEASMGRSVLAKHWSQPLLCHNAAFDLAVAHERMELPLPKGENINDTMFLAFLLDPYGDLGLKPLAERYLGLPPIEQTAVRDYLYTNKIIKRTVKKWAAHISEAPGALVGTYAVGDVDRTKMLYDFMAPIVREKGMWEAYRRECDIVPMLLRNAAQGIPLDRFRLYADTAFYEETLRIVEQELRMNWPKELGCSAPANFDSGDELADCLQHDRRIVLPKTPTGRVSTAKDALMDALPLCRVKALLLYRSALEKCLSTYMRPWLAQGSAIHCNWNQVRDFSDRGAKTGRLSSSPNLQNITNPEKYEELAAFMALCHVSQPPLPNLRSYIVAPEGMVLFSRDYSQQELRLLAHYEDGTLAQAYRDDPDMDTHTFVAGLIRKVSGASIERKPTKTINFGKIYGMGGPGLAKKLKIDLDAAYALLNAYDAALPSVKALQRWVGDEGKRGNHITTLGGRRYYSPPAELDDDRGGVRTYEYKLLNYLIQGSAADQTKEAMRHWWRYMQTHTDHNARFLLTVHDQLVGCCPVEDAQFESEVLDVCMTGAFDLDVPVKTDATYGYNFGEMTTELPVARKRRMK